MPDEITKNVRAMSDDDVRNEMKVISKMPEVFTNSLFHGYSATIQSIVALALAHCDDDEDAAEIDSLRRLVKLCPLEELFIRTKDKVWAVRNHILGKNASYFLEKDYSGMIKQDSNKAFIETLMEIIKTNFQELDTSDQNEYWKKAATLLNYVGQFKKKMNELRI